jgi:hypothetical protein
MEWWILLALAVAGLAIGARSRLRRIRRRPADADGKNIYPLW